MRAPNGGPKVTVRGVGGIGPISTDNVTPQTELEALRLANNLDAGNVLLNSGGLAINGAGLLVAKTSNTIDYIVAGVLATAAAAALPTLVGTITQNNFGGWAFTIDVGGTTRARFLNQAATLAGVTMPAIPVTETILGYVRLNPTTANFVGGTTALDAASTNAIYVNTPFGLGFIINKMTG